MNYDESQEQQMLFKMAAYKSYRGGTVRDYLYAIPNGGTTGGRRAMLAGVRRKAEGVTAGVPDVFCFAKPPTGEWRGLCIEMKRKDGKPSDVSKAQRDMMLLLSAEGYKCEVCFGSDHAWKSLCQYLDLTT